jgi:16S rRNA (adenine1518-N6/adenine1519-N6)-dimethyltransferase
MPSSTFRIRPRKSLGQNFLRDDNIVRKIIRAINPVPGDLIVEIGPGEGAMTKHLAVSGARVTAVEIDPRAVQGLREAFGGQAVEIRQGDVLEMDFAELAREQGGRLRVVGNIPYNITTPILFRLIDYRNSIRDATLMVQKEVARRMAGKSGTDDYGILSLFCAYYTKPAILFDVSPNAFHPKPEVTSSIIRFTMRERPELEADDDAFFRSVVRSAFGKRRKTLRNSLGYLARERGFELPNLPDLVRRPEELSLKEFVLLSNQLLSVSSTHNASPSRHE